MVNSTGPSRDRADVHVSGDVSASCDQLALGIENLDPALNDLLLAVCHLFGPVGLLLLSLQRAPLNIAQHLLGPGARGTARPAGPLTIESPERQLKLQLERGAPGIRPLDPALRQLDIRLP